MQIQVWSLRSDWESWAGTYTPAELPASSELQFSGQLRNTTNLSFNLLIKVTMFVYFILIRQVHVSSVFKRDVRDRAGPFTF